MPQLDPNYILLAIAVFQALTAFLTLRTHSLTLLVEKNTNSMKDALVASTSQASHAEGKEQGRVEGEEKAAELAKEQLRVKEGK